MKSKRVISFALALSILSANVAYADQVVYSNKSKHRDNQVVNTETGEIVNETLTAEQAAEKAITYSHTLKTLAESKGETDNSYDNTLMLFNRFVDTETTSSNQQLILGLKQLMNGMRSIDANEKIAKDGIRLNVKNVFNSIKSAEDDIKLYEENMVIQEKDIKVAEVKKNLGLISQLEYNSKVTAYNTTVSERNSLKTTLDSAYRSLNELMGVDLNKKYDLVYDEIIYTPMEKVNLQTKINQALSTAEVIKSKKDAYDIAEFDQRTYVPSGTVGEFAEKENAVAQASRNLEDAKTKLSQSITSLYENITQAEVTYTDTVNSINLLKNQYDVIKTQYEMGKATELDVLNVEYNIHKAEAGLDKLIRGYDLMVQQFNNPDLIQ